VIKGLNKYVVIAAAIKGVKMCDAACMSIIVKATMIATVMNFATGESRIGFASTLMAHSKAKDNTTPARASLVAPFRHRALIVPHEAPKK
jgi:hypothetical protein